MADHATRCNPSGIEVRARPAHRRMRKSGGRRPSAGSLARNTSGREVSALALAGPETTCLSCPSTLPATPIVYPGSGLEFRDRGAHEHVKGVPGQWQKSSSARSPRRRGETIRETNRYGITRPAHAGPWLQRRPNLNSPTTHSPFLVPGRGMSASHLVPRQPPLQSRRPASPPVLCTLRPSRTRNDPGASTLRPLPLNSFLLPEFT